MSKFMVRVELHDADAHDYDDLHDEMKAEGFKRSVEASDGLRYHLPPGVYRMKSKSKSACDVRELAAKAAASVKPKFAVVVCDGSTFAWQGLDKVE